MRRTAQLLTLLTCLGAFAVARAERVLTVWGMGEEGKKLRQMADLFERQHPGVRVRLQAIPWDASEAKLLTAVVGQITPDVVQLGTTFVPKFAAMDAIEPLDHLLDGAGAVRRADFYPGPLKTATYKGRLFGIPWYIDTWVLYYRSDLLAGVGFPRPPRTWDELRRVGRRLAADLDGDGKQDRFGIGLGPNDGAALAVFAAQAGSQVVDDRGRIGVTDPGFRKALRFYISLFDEKIAPRGQIKDTDLFAAFEQGLYPMLIGGPWMLTQIERQCPSIRGKWSVGLLPTSERPSSFVGGSVLSIFKRSTHKRLAGEFIRFMSQTHNQLRWYQISTTLPPTRSAWSALARLQDPLLLVFGEQLRSAEAPPAIPEWEEIQDKLGRDYLGKLVYHVENPDVALPRLKQEIAAILAKTDQALHQSAASKLAILGLIGLGLLAIIVVLFRRRQTGPPELGGLDVRDVRAARRVPYLLLLPALAVLVIFLFMPILIAFLMSFTDWNIYAITDWNRISVTGLANYRALLWEFHAGKFAAIGSTWGYLAFWNYLGDPVFWRALFNTFAFVLFGVPLSIVVSLTAALALNQAFLRGKGLFRAGFFMPVVTTMVAVAVVWRWLYNPRHGLINHALQSLGLAGQDWLSDPALALPALIVMAVWKNFGYNMIIFIAGLQTIPAMYYEAANIDGASRYQQLRHVTLPLLAPTMYFVSIMTLIGYFQFFAEPYVMTGGGPLNSTMSIVLYMYNQGFRFYNLGYATAIAFVLFLFISGFTLGQARLSRRALRY